VQTFVRRFLEFSLVLLCLPLFRHRRFGILLEVFRVFLVWLWGVTWGGTLTWPFSFVFLVFCYVFRQFGRVGFLVGWLVFGHFGCL
jgi:hypothetical protein